VIGRSKAKSAPAPAAAKGGRSRIGAWLAAGALLALPAFWLVTANGADRALAGGHRDDVIRGAVYLVAFCAAMLAAALLGAKLTNAALIGLVVAAAVYLATINSPNAVASIGDALDWLAQLVPPAPEGPTR
jgi:hypothetical protein